jgi:hypothetical protein
MKRKKHFWNEFSRSMPLSSSYMTITGSGIAMPQSIAPQMQNYENSESPSAEAMESPAQEAAEGASMNSGSGAAAGAAATGAGGSGVA